MIFLGSSVPVPNPDDIQVTHRYRTCSMTMHADSSRVGRRARSITLLLLGMTVLGATACGSDSTDKSSPGSTSPNSTEAGAGFSETKNIVIKGFAFKPEKAAAKVGDTITVKNDDATLHSLTAKDDKSLFDTGQYSEGERKITLTKAGTFDFVCEVHTYMKGVIQVHE